MLRPKLLLLAFNGILLEAEAEVAAEEGREVDFNTGWEAVSSLLSLLLIVSLKVKTAKLSFIGLGKELQKGKQVQNSRYFLRP